ncbi:MAG: hypothetical protein NVSMB48_04420 [Marmoricola sp.]
MFSSHWVIVAEAGGKHTHLPHSVVAAVFGSAAYRRCDGGRLPFKEAVAGLRFADLVGRPSGVLWQRL